MQKPLYAVALAGLGLVTANAEAETIIQAPSLGEDSHEQIFEDIFGEDFSANGLGFTGATVEVTRVSDDDDQTYDALNWSAEALISWAGAIQAFGTISDGQLFDVVGSYGFVSGSTGPVSGGANIAFARYGDDPSYDDIIASTNPGDNPFGNDHVVTYQYSVNGQLVENTYLLFFEDLPEGGTYADFDYNDLVVRITLDPRHTPEPGSLALLTLGAVTMLRRRR